MLEEWKELLEKDIEEISDFFDDEWNEKSFAFLNYLIKEDSNIIKDFIKEIGSNVDYGFDRKNLIPILNSYNQDLAIELFLDDDITNDIFQEKELLEYIKENHVSYRHIVNENVKILLDKQYLNDETLFENTFGEIDGKDAIACISSRTKKLAEKIFFRHKTIILKRFSLAGKEEASQMRCIIEHGFLDEKNLKRAIKRIIKQTPNSLPLQAIVKNELLSQEDILEAIDARGWDKTYDLEDETIPSYVIEAMVEKLNHHRVDSLKKKIYSNEQRRRIIEDADINDLLESLNLLKEDELKILLDRAETIDSKEINIDVDSIDSVFEKRESLGLKLLDIMLKSNSYKQSSLFNSKIITGSQLLELAKENDNSDYLLKLAQDKKVLEKLKLAGKDQDFADLAFKKVKKRNIKELSEYLAEYLSEEEKKKLDEEAVKSIDGAKKFLLNEANKDKDKIRAKAISKIASSAPALNEVLSNNPELFSQKECKKIISYSKAKEYLVEKDTVKILLILAKHLDTKDLDSLFVNKCLFTWNEELLSKVSTTLIDAAVIDKLENPNGSYHSPYPILRNEKSTVVQSIIKKANKNKKIRSIVLEQKDSYVSKKYMESLSSIEGINEESVNKIPKEYQFAYSKNTKEVDFDNAKKYFQKNKDEYPFQYIKENIDLFLSKWKTNEQKELITLMYQKAIQLNDKKNDWSKDSFSFLLTAKDPSVRAIVIEKFIEIAKKDSLEFVKSNQNSIIRKFTKEEINSFSKILLANPSTMSYILQKWEDTDILLIADFDYIINLLLSDTLSVLSIPKTFAKGIVEQAIRQQDSIILDIVFKSFRDRGRLKNIDAIIEKVSNQTEASFVAEFLSKKQDSLYYIRKMVDELKEFDFKKVLMEELIKNNENYSRRHSYNHTSELLEMYEGKFSLELIPRLLKAATWGSTKTPKSELKNLVDVLTKQGLEREIHYFLVDHPRALDEVMPKKFIDELYTEDILNDILENDPSEKDLNLLLKSNNITKDLKARTIKELFNKSLFVIKKNIEENSFGLFFRQVKYINFDSDFQRLTYLDLFEEMDGFFDNEVSFLLEEYLKISNTSGTINFSSKIFTSKDGEKIELNRLQNVSYSTNRKDQDYMSQIYALQNYGTEAILEAVLDYSSSGFIQCKLIVDDLYKNCLRTSSERSRKLAKKVEDKIDSLKSEFSNILGDMEKEYPFGIEMEFSSRIKRETIQKKIKSHNKDINIVSMESYGSTVGDNWEIKPDSSIEGRFSAEVVSPKLYGEEGITELKSVLNALEPMFIKGFIKSSAELDCGIHVHHDLSQIEKSYDNLNEIAKALYVIQDPLYSICHKERSSNDYCSKLNFRNANHMDYQHRGGFNISNNKGTLEYRMREGFFDKEAIERWVRLTKTLTQEIIELHKKEHIGKIDKLSEGLEDVLSAIMIEKAIQLKGESQDYADNYETIEAFMLTDLLLKRKK